MEPLDTAKNNSFSENVGSSRRRLSSILKAPRTSIKCNDTEQVENQMEVAKPVEKRNSRRVSFAPADDVLLFPKDLKNYSPVRSPLQNLTTTVENLDKKIQMGGTEEGIQPVTGMETLLKAPLHASQQNKKMFVDIHNTEDYGEKTMIFTDDVSMDVTHSQTVIIANDSESHAVLPDPNCGFLPSCGNMDATSSVVSRKADIHGQSVISSSIHGMDPEFENFLSSISKQSVPRANTCFAKMECNAIPSLQGTVGPNVVLDQVKTQWADVDKENRTPDFISAVVEKPLCKAEKIREPFKRSINFQEDGERMDMTGSTVGITPGDNPLQCLFPTSDLYQESGNQKPLKMILGQQIPEPLGYTSSNSVGVEIKNKTTVDINSKIYENEVSSVNKSRSIGGLNLTKVPTISERDMMTHSAIMQCMSSHREVASNNPFVSDSDEMDITRSQTIAIDAKSLCIDNTVQNKKQRMLFMKDSCKTRKTPEDFNDMEMTRCQTRIIEAKIVAKPALNIGPIESVGISKDIHVENMFQQKDGIKYAHSKSDDMELTQSQIVATDTTSLHTVDTLLNKKGMHLPFTKAIGTREDECCMDQIKPLTVSVNHSPLSDGSKGPNIPLKSKLCKMDSETVTSTVGSDSDEMEFTRCQTRIIDAKNLDVVKPMLSLVNEKPSRILGNDGGTNESFQQGSSTKYTSWESNDMEITKSQTVAIDAERLHIMYASQDTKQKSLSMTALTKATRASDECFMDTEKSLIVSVDHRFSSGGSKVPSVPLESKLDEMEHRPVTSTVGADSDEMEFTRCQTRIIETKNLDVVKPMLSLVNEKPSRTSGNDGGTNERFQQGSSTKYSSWESDDMEITKSQTVAIDAKDLQTLNEPHNKNKKSLYLLKTSTTTAYASKDECDLDMSKPLTASVDQFTLSGGSRMSNLALQIKLCKTDSEPVTSTLGADYDEMEFTRCQTRIIETKNLDVVKPTLSVGKKTFRTSEDDNDTDEIFQQRGSTKYTSWESDDMEITKSQTVAIDAESLHTIYASQNKKRKSLSFRTKATHASEDEGDMDMIKPLTVSVDQSFLSGGSKISSVPLGSKLGDIEHKTVTSTLGADSDDMEFTTCQTGIIEAKTLNVAKPTFSVDKKTVRLSGEDNDTHEMCESDDMEITKSQTVAIDAESLHTMYASQNKRRKSLSFRTKATHASEDEGDMDMTKPLTVSADHLTLSGGSQMSNMPSERNLGKMDCEAASSTSEADSNEMEFTGSQTRVTENKNLGAIKSLLSSMVEGPLDILNSTRKLLSERNEKEMTPALTSAIASNDSQDVSDSFQKDQTNAKVLTTAMPSVKLSESGHKSQPLTLHLNGRDSKKTHPIDVSSETTEMQNQTSCKAVGSLKSPLKKTPNLREITSCDQTSCATVKSSSGTTAFHHKENNIFFSACMVSEEDEMEISIASKKNNGQLDEQGKGSDGSPLTEERSKRSVSLPVSFEPTNTENGKDPELTNTNSQLQVLESLPNISPVVHHVDKLSSRNAKTTRMSLVDLQSTLRQMGYMTDLATEKISMDSCTAPVSQLEMTSDKNPIKINPSVVENDCEMKLSDKEEHAQSSDHTTVAETCGTAPLNLRSKCLTSRISVGSFKAKLPQRGKPPKSNTVESNGLSSLGGYLKMNTGDFTHQLTSDMLVDNIEDEVLLSISDEDFSGTLDTNAAQRICGKENCIREPSIEVSLGSEVFEKSSPSATHVEKRCFAHDEDTAVDGKRRKPSIDNIAEMGESFQVDECSNTDSAAPSINTQTIDPSSSGNTAGLGYEATSESTFKQSLFATQLEDPRGCTNDIQKKLDDGSITVLEFFNLFNLDFVIHNPRQSVLPGKIELYCKPEDLLKGRHINHPKQRVYEMDNQILTEKVERLKARMKDREKLLRHINPGLWEEMRCFPEEELKVFGAKLKERNDFFRKQSKVHSHEMKEVLYSKLHHANMNEQQKLREKLDESDVMMKNLDDCIHELESELKAVEGKGLIDSKSTLESAEQGLEVVTRALADNEKQINELEVQKKCNLDKVKRLKTETQDLENHITMLHRINEWKLEEKQVNFQVYTFLYKTFYLEVVFEKCEGNKAPERNIVDIIFKFDLDEKASQCHARFVHNLLSQYIEGETSWVKKYPTAKCIPKLLHDVGLVVSRCRLLGEEVHRLKLLGALRLNILDINCVDTRVNLLFSSLEAFVKFELSIALTAAYPFCVPQVQNYKNHIGNTTFHQIEEIVSSITPAKNLLTRIMKRINQDLF